MDAPVVAVSNDGKLLGAAWMDTREGNGNRDVRWTMGPFGRLPSESRANDNDKGRQGHPTLAFDGEGTLWCAWADGRAGGRDQRIYAADFKTGTNVAITTEAEGKCDFPSLAFDGEVLGVCYEAAAGVAFRRLPR